MQPFQKNEALDFSKESVQQAFVQDAQSGKALLQKELNVNQAEQGLLSKRIRMMKSFINDLPSSDPQYSMMVAQVQMDQIEIDELKIRETILTQKLSE